MFDDYFGAHAVMLTKPDDLGGFNDHLATAVFVFLNGPYGEGTGRSRCSKIHNHQKIVGREEVYPEVLSETAPTL